MNAQEILQSQIQLDFRSDIISALTTGDGINPQVSTELNKLTSKKSYLIQQLGNQWVNRGMATFFPPSKIFEINLAHFVKLEEKGKFDSVARQSKLSEKNLILETGYANYGFDPTTRKFSYLVSFNKDPSLVFGRFETITEVDPNNQSVNFFATLRKYIDEFKQLHFLDTHITQVFLHFSKTFYLKTLLPFPGSAIVPIYFLRPYCHWETPKLKSSRSEMHLVI